LLPSCVYDELFNLGAQAQGTNFVEVGTAHGAATIALALGAATRPSLPCRIWTIDKMGGRFSTRSKYGSPENNKQIALKNFRRAGIEDMIELFVGSSDDFIVDGRCPERIDLLLLDADGRIDRDLLYFYPRMSIGSPIVIDDVDHYIYLGRNHEGIPYIDLKHRIKSFLLTAYETTGFIRFIKRIENTAFCERGEREYDSAVFTQIALECYRELVISEVQDSYWQELLCWSENSYEVREGLRMRQAIPPTVRKLGGKLRRMWKRFAKPSIS